jgi:Xaa-Pro aminopeptidase
MAATSSPFVSLRLARIPDELRGAGLDALVVTHLPNVRYLTGFSGSAGAVVLFADRAVLVVDFRYVTTAREISAASGSEIAIEVADRTYDEAIAAVLRREDARRIGIEAAYMPVGRFNRLSAALASGSPSPLGSGSGESCPSLVPTERFVERARVVKDAGEVKTLREGAKRLSAVAREAAAFVRAGRSERDIAADIDAAVRRAGFERPAFETIVAGGPNSALPHARPGRRAVLQGEGVVLDFGGVYDGYCVDLTRTLHLGERQPAFRRLFAAVADAHAAAIAAVRPGIRPSDIDAAARDTLARHGLAEAFGHGTGHGLGLEVHEEPRITRAELAQPDAPVEPGMVFTIEPGAYVPGTGGVRIEDDVLVVDDGCEVLTDVPIEL